MLRSQSIALTVPLAATLICLNPLMAHQAAAQGGKHYGQFAPPDAYRDGSKLAYYGSENDWDRRMFTEQRADNFYKRRGQRQLLGILDGHADQVLLWCQQRIAEDPADLESRFMSTIAWCQLGKPEEAFSEMEAALAAGLPLERYLAGPRNLLQPLTTTLRFQELVAERAIKLVHGPMLGCVSDRSARFWVRTAGESRVTIRLFDSPTGKVPVQSASAQSRASADFTARVQVEGL